MVRIMCKNKVYLRVTVETVNKTGKINVFSRTYYLLNSI